MADPVAAEDPLDPLVEDTADEDDAPGDVASIWPTDRRRFTAGVAALVFALFALVTLWLHDAAGIGTGELGLSVWTASGPTESRVTPVVNAVLHKNAIAGWLANGIDPSRVETDDASNASPKIWNAALDLAEALSDDDARARLASTWTQEMQTPDRLAKLHELTNAYFVAIRKSPKATQSANKALDGLVEMYDSALGTVGAAWVADELPPAAILGMLQANDLAIRVSPAPAKKNARHGGRGTAPPAKPTTATFVTELQRSAAAYLASRGVRDRVRVSWQQDLSFGSAQKPLTTATDRDYAGRWMWTIAAAIFITAAISAVLGAVWRLYTFTHPGERILPLIACLLFVVIGAAAGWMNLRPVPAFLTEPLGQFNDFYKVQVQWTSALLKSVALAAICALLVSSWSSFLFRTKDDNHLSQQLALLRWSFHTATFVLVAGVLHVYAFYQWPSSFLGEDAAMALQSGARVFSLALGAVFSTLLLLIYIPGASVLVGEARARQVEARAGTPKEKGGNPAGGGTRAEQIEKMLEEHGFDAAPMQQIVRFAQLFAPLLIAPLGAEIVSLLGS
jgi:hypothetical protein